jgi:hypothetical protein
MLLDPLETVFSHHGKQLMTTRWCRRYRRAEIGLQVLRSILLLGHFVGSDSRAQTTYVHTMTFPPRYYLNLQGEKIQEKGRGTPPNGVSRHTTVVDVCVYVSSPMSCLLIITIFLVGSDSVCLDLC